MRRPFELSGRHSGAHFNQFGPLRQHHRQFVAFASVSSNLVQNVSTAASQIFVRDTCLGQTCTPVTFLSSFSYNGTPGNGPSSEPSIDSSAGNIAYTSLATNLVNYVPVNGGIQQVYWQAVCVPAATSTGTSTTAGTIPVCATSSTTTVAGTTPTNTVVLPSVGADGSAGNGNSYNPVVSPDGQFVAFVSLATNLVSGATVDGVTPQVYLRTSVGNDPISQSDHIDDFHLNPTTYLVSSPDGVTPGNAPSSHPAVSNGGTYVAFVSTASNLSVANPNNAQEIFEQDECELGNTGCVPTWRLFPRRMDDSRRRRKFAAGHILRRPLRRLCVEDSERLLFHEACAV